MSSGIVESETFGITVNSGTYQGTGGTITAISQAALYVRNTGSATATNVIIKGSGTGNGGKVVINDREYGYCIIRSREINYGITGGIGRGIIATSNTGVGQASENITIYNTTHQYLLFPTWSERVIGGTSQDDLIWTQSYSANGTHTITVNKSEHNNDTGTYIVDVYEANLNYEVQGSTIVRIILTF